MGGRGSGNRYRGSTKPTEDNFWRFSIAALKKHAVVGEHKLSSGVWSWLRNGEKCCSISYEINTLTSPAWLRVEYVNKGTGKNYDYKIPLTTTQPHYGGERWWFICPAQGCSKRVSVLYLAQIFACRRCCNFTYTSQNEAPAFRLLSRAQKLHQQLGGDGYVELPPSKPKDMHWKTYWQRVAEIEHTYRIASLEAVRCFGSEIDI